MISDKVFRRSEFYKNILGIIALILAALWGVYTFYYQNIYIPNKQPPYIIVSTNHEIQGETDSFFVIRSSIEIENLSKTRANILGTSYTLYGFKISPLVWNDSAYRQRVKKYIDTFSIFPRYYEENYSVINTGKLMDGAWWLDPEEKFRRSFLSLVPKNKFDAVKFFIVLYASKDVDDKIIARYNVSDFGEVLLSLYTMPENKPVDLNSDKELITEFGIGKAEQHNELYLPAHTRKAKPGKN